MDSAGHSANNAWTQWWWAKASHYRHWSVDERRAAGAFWLAFFGLFLAIGLYGCFAMHYLRFGASANILIGIVLGLSTAILNARSVGSEIFPLITSRGDQASAKRMGCEVRLPPRVPRLWWIDYRYTDREGEEGQWSPEEIWARNVICGLAAIIWFTPIHWELGWFAEAGLSRQAAALTIVLAQLPLSFCLSRTVCICLWPDYMRLADDNAMRRVNRKSVLR
jgi:hypothetical protein